MKIKTVLLAAGLLLAATNQGRAIPFSVTDTINNNNGMLLTFGNSSDNFYSSVFAETVTFTPALGSFNSANLDVTYSNIATTGELFAAYISNTGGAPTPANLLDYVSVGTLPGYDDLSKHTRTFNLNGILPTIPVDGLDSWILYVAFREMTSGNDKMTLWELRTYGDYNEFVPKEPNGGEFIGNSDPTNGVVPTPEPSTVVLLGLGLAGMGIAARRKKNT